MNKWKWEGGSLRRRRPIRIVDREGLTAVIARIQGNGGFPSITFNGGQAEANSLSDVLAQMPRYVTDMSIYGDGGAIDLTTKHFGRSNVTGTSVVDIIRTLEQHGRPVSLLSRLLWVLPLVREQSVVSPRRRDEVEDRAEGRRNAMISAIFGLMGGVVGGVATLYAAARWGGL